MKGIGAAAILACLAIPPAAVRQATPTAGPTMAAEAGIAARQVSIPDPGHAPITAALWYPAAGGGDPLPLVVISHGTGAGPASHIDTARALAEAGFVVVAPMHSGDNFQDDSSVGRPEWLGDRSRHVSRTIDYMLGQWEGRARLNPQRIGLFGFSAGATTALISIGGVPDLGRLAPHCSAQPEFVCAIIAQQPAPEGSAAPQWTHDPRIGAAVVAAPGLGFTFEPGGLSAVRVPVQLWAGEQDRTVPYETNAGVVRRLLPQQPDFHNVERAAHLSFLAPCTAETPPQLCQDPEGFDRAAFHADFNRSVIDFFRRSLR